MIVKFKINHNDKEFIKIPKILPLKTKQCSKPNKSGVGNFH